VDVPYLFVMRAAVLLGALGIAGYCDLRNREVPDGLWIVMGFLGGALFILGGYGGSALALALDIVAALFVIEHFLPWDRALDERPNVATAIEGAIYVGVVALAFYCYVFIPSAVSPEFLVVVVSVLVARGLFELRLLYGGADAKALMAAALVLPIWTQPLLKQYPAAITQTMLPNFPFAVTILINGALLTLVVPVGLFIYNMRKHFYSIPEAFMLYEIPTEELPRRFVWLRKPPLDTRVDVDTTEEDIEMRKAQAKELMSRGINRVWVTPQLPMVLALAVGAVIGILFGNILFWII
jgi:preflagellin peptidase FlaK